VRAREIGGKRKGTAPQTKPDDREILKKRGTDDI